MGNDNNIVMQECFCDDIFETGVNNEIHILGGNEGFEMQKEIINHISTLKEEPQKIGDFDSKKENKMTSYTNEENKRVIGSLEDICAICKENYQRNDNIEYLGCSHFFHRSCLVNWFKNKVICPICKNDDQI